MGTYKLSPIAEEDLEEIFYTGVLTFGLQQADIYYDGLIDRLQKIAENPLMYPAVPEIREGYRRCTYRAHSIYYKAESDPVYIVRILQRQDVAEI